MAYRVPVMVVGSGLAGLSSAVFLADRGVDVLLVERHSGTSVFPAAVGQNLRTMELLGFAGIADRVPAVPPGLSRFRVRIAGTLPGPTFHEMVSETDTGESNALSPARPGTAGQDKMEPILRRRAEELGVESRFETELVSFEQDADGVTAVLRDRGGRTSEVRADYLVAADGNRSGVREALGIGRHGSGTLGHNVSIIFDADLGGLLDPEPPTLHVLHNERADGVFITVDAAAGRHLFSVTYDPAAGQSPADFTAERCVELVRAVTELPDLRPDIKAVRPWDAAALVADRFVAGRVVLAGDAAKVTPPSGGFGGNTAIGDGYDLAWKLAAVLAGTAGPALLETYDAERRPIADRVVAEAERLAGDRGPAAGPGESSVAEGPSGAAGGGRTGEPGDLGVLGDLGDELSDQERAEALVLGFRYRSPVILTEDGDSADSENPHRPTGRPGFRAPHTWLERDGEKLSALDLFGRGFVLLSGAEGGSWGAAAAGASARLGVEVRSFAIGRELADTDGRFPARYGVGASGASLIRPDGVVAWRCAEAPDDPEAALLEVLTAVLAR